ncbi:MAG: glycosyltransferase [Candidatus Micrarchaeaceae archaeon]
MRPSNYSDFTVVLPTLNEEKTIGKLIHYIISHYRGMRVIVVDDGSTDATEILVGKIAAKSKNVKLINRHRLGLERGLTASIAFGICASTTKYTLVMDADLQHPPQVLGALAERLLKGSDIAVAVRARVPHWAFYRKLISKSLMLIGNAALMLHGKKSCSDILSGFFGIRTRLFIEIYKRNKGRFVAQGYKVLFDLLKCAGQDISISEVPYTFMARKSGASKAGIRQGLALLKSFST